MQNEYSNLPLEYSMDETGSSALPQTPMSSSPEEPTRARAGHSARRNSVGARKGGPESFISMDAPTQARRYLTPSSTSRKEIPAFFHRMPTNTPPSGDEEDELIDEAPAPNATDQEKIEWKRRQNTLAARRSRQRKLAHLQQLEETVDRLTKERDIWRTRALAMRQLLQSHNIACPEFRD